jgi:hypothetical protein
LSATCLRLGLFASSTTIDNADRQSLRQSADNPGRES